MPSSRGVAPRPIAGPVVEPVFSKPEAVTLPGPLSLPTFEIPAPIPAMPTAGSAEVSIHPAWALSAAQAVAESARDQAAQSPETIGRAAERVGRRLSEPALEAVREPAPGASPALALNFVFDRSRPAEAKTAVHVGWTGARPAGLGTPLRTTASVGQEPPILLARAPIAQQGLLYWSGATIALGAVLLLLSLRVRGVRAWVYRVIAAGAVLSGVLSGWSLLDRPAPPAPAAAAPAEPRQAPAVPAWHKDQVAEWERLLGRFEGSRAHADFLRTEGIRIRIDPDMKFNLLRNVNAYYKEEHGHSATINGGWLLEVRKWAERSGVPEEELVRVVGLKTFPTIVHEIGHGITHERFEAAVGFDFDMPWIENEFLSFAQQAMIEAEIEEKEPHMSGFYIGIADEKTLLEAWKKGPEALEAYVRQEYPGTASLEDSTDEELASRYEETAKEIEELVRVKTELFELSRKLGELRSPPAAPDRELLFQIEVNLGMLARYRRAAEVFRDKASADKVRRFYAEERARVEREWDSPRWRAWRAAWDFGDAFNRQRFRWDPGKS